MAFSASWQEEPRRTQVLRSPERSSITPSPKILITGTNVSEFYKDIGLECKLFLQNNASQTEIKNGISGLTGYFYYYSHSKVPAESLQFALLEEGVLLSFKVTCIRTTLKKYYLSAKKKAQPLFLKIYLKDAKSRQETELCSNTFILFSNKRHR